MISTEITIKGEELTHYIYSHTHTHICIGNEKTLLVPVNAFKEDFFFWTVQLTVAVDYYTEPLSSIFCLFFELLMSIPCDIIGFWHRPNLEKRKKKVVISMAFTEPRYSKNGREYTPSVYQSHGIWHQCATPLAHFSGDWRGAGALDSEAVPGFNRQDRNSWVDLFEVDDGAIFVNSPI